MRNLIEKHCGLCNKIFFTRPCDEKRGRGRFCSNVCKSRYGRSLQDQCGEKNPRWKGGVWRANTAIAAKRWKEQNPDKVRVHRIVEQEIKSGRLVRSSCAKCGSTKNIDAHHEDYSQPLLIEWLCRGCHLIEHRR